MIGIVCASHGRIAEGAIDTLKMFSDGQQMESACLMPSMDMVEFIEILKEKIDAVNTGDGVILFCDLLFGTPCNISAKLLADDKYKDQLEVITGMNLSMLLELTCERTQEDKIDISKLMNVGKDGIVDFKQKVQNK